MNLISQNNSSFKKELLLIFVLSTTILFCYSQTGGALRLDKNNIRQIVGSMTLDEKAKIVNGIGFNINGMTPMDHKPANAKDEKVLGAAGNSYAIPRLGIPSLVFSDGPAGIRIQPIRYGDKSKTFYTTAFPIGFMLASSWDIDLIKQVGVAYGNEALEYGIDIALAPGVNIQRNPLCGRNYEYYSEDPVVTGNIAAAFINGVQSVGVGATIKHFAVNNEESNRSMVNVLASQRALREIYLRGFEIAIKKSNPWTVMSSYNKLNGIYTCESSDLMDKVLRKEWGYKGLVMSDWYAGKDPVAQLRANNNLIMPGSGKAVRTIVSAVKEGLLDEKILDENVVKVMEMILKSPVYKKYAYSDKPDLKKSTEIARKAAEESAVLLKNNNVLPVTSNTKIALLGNTSYEMIKGGKGSGDVNAAYVISLNEGLVNSGCKIDKVLAQEYVEYIKEERKKYPVIPSLLELPETIQEMPVDQNKLAKLAKDADLAIYTIGRISIEGADRKINNDFCLTSIEQQQIKNISDAFHNQGKKVLVVLNIGGPIEMASWRNMVDGILLAWQPGQEGGNAIANIINGAVNPSGKLTSTFPVKYEDVPSSGFYPGKEIQSDEEIHLLGGKPAESVYKEGIYVGYRYYNTFNVKPAYEFGFGLSYSKFEYNNLILSTKQFKDKIQATVKITNVGKVSGKEIVQLYISAPHELLDKPSEELKAFAKTKLLKPGESQLIIFELSAKDLASYYSKENQWIAEAGKYIVKVGASSSDIRLSKQFEIGRQIVVEKTTNAFVPQKEILELKY